MVNNMKFIHASAFILFITVTLVHAGVYQETYLRNEKYPGKCVFGNTVINPGQTVKHPTVDCAEITCDNAIGLATIETCDPVSALDSPLKKLKDYDHTDPPTCKWGDFKNINAPLPKCCERHFTCVF